MNDSFITTKANPNDIDFVTFLDFATYRKHDKDLEELGAIRYDKNFGTDGYFVEVFPDWHTNYDNFVMGQVEWLHVFGTSRSVQNKRIIKLSF